MMNMTGTVAVAGAAVLPAIPAMAVPQTEYIINMNDVYAKAYKIFKKNPFRTSVDYLTFYKNELEYHSQIARSQNMIFHVTVQRLGTKGQWPHHSELAMHIQARDIADRISIREHDGSVTKYKDRYPNG